MKMYRIGLCYSGYVWQEVKAINEDAVYDKAAEIAENACHDPVITDWERWTEADQIEESDVNGIFCKSEVDNV